MLSHNPVKIIEQVLSKYRRVVKEKESENSKATYFAAIFLYDIFKVDPAEIEWEYGVKTVYMKKRGRIDAVFGNVIFEFKKNLSTAIKVAEEELLKYFQTYHEKYAGTDFIGIANDGILFKAYKPIFSHTETGKRIKVIGVRETDSLNLNKTNDAQQIYNWFDSYLFLQRHIVPTSDDIKKRFGLKSATYNTFKDELWTLHKLIEDTEFFKTKFQNWSKYLEIVYGDSIEELDLFIRHTYLSTLVKLMVHVRLTGGKVFQEKDMPIILHGHSFHGWEIHNFVEEDFFTWITYPHFDKKVNPMLFKLLNQIVEVYDLEKINEDVLKELYQELVDPEYRQELGEFYTPDWLAEMSIDELLKNNPKQSVLDPSCGSGTFLFSAIKYKIDRLRSEFPDDNDLLTHVLSTVKGFDIHPLAVIIAKTNYLLALGKLPYHKKHPIEIPVYLCDSVKLPSEKSSLFSGKNVFDIQATEKHFFQIPTDTISKTANTDDVIKKMHDHAQSYQDAKFRNENVPKESRDRILAMNRENLLKGFRNAVKNISSEPTRKLWIENYQLLIKLIDEDRDSIWPYIIKNATKPMALSKDKVDIIMGNPPWITIKKMKNETYKKFLKEGSQKYGLFDKSKKYLYTHMELATLFFCIVVDLYLKDKGHIGFVMPSSILRAAHHENFMKFLNPKVELNQNYTLYEMPELKIDSMNL